MLGDRGLAFAYMVPCCGALETLSVLEPEPAPEEVSVPWTRSAAYLTMLSAASLSDRLVDRRMSCSSSFSNNLTARLQRLPLFATFCCSARSFCRRSRSCTRSKVVIGLFVSGVSVDPSLLKQERTRTQEMPLKMSLFGLPPSV